MKFLNWTCKHHTNLISMDYGHMKVVVIVRKVLIVFSTNTRSVGPLGLGRSPAFKGGRPDVAHVLLCEGDDICHIKQGFQAMSTLYSLLCARYATGDLHPKSRTFHGR